MYVIKVGEYYVSLYEYTNIELSKEIMVAFDKDRAISIAKMINGKVIKINEEVSNV